MFERSCKICNVLKKRVPGNRRKRGTGFYYFDAEGKIWNGLVCYSCDKVRALKRQKDSRCSAKKEESEGLTIELNPLTKRQCRACSLTLRASDYFYHEVCRPKVEFRDFYLECSTYVR